jgi:hypothetical protein
MTQKVYLCRAIADQGSMNLVMLKVTHYTREMSFADFCAINHGRIVPVGLESHQVGRFEYHSDGAGQFVDCDRKW